MEKDSQANLAMACKLFGSIDIATLLSASEGILTGGGGGFTRRFTDFIIEGTMGFTSLNYYALGSTGEVEESHIAPLLLNNRANEYARLMQMAVDIDFFKIKLAPPISELLRHTVVAHPDYGIHRVVWAVDASPTPPEELVKFDLELRRFLTEGFKEEFGR